MFGHGQITGYPYSYSRKLPEVDIMERIQKLFELLAGISAAEDARLARARAIFSAPGPDLAALQTPACWRRKQRIGHH